MELFKFEKIIRSLRERKITNYIDYSEDFLEYYDVNNYFNSLRNTKLLLGNVDIDFPPPKKPYSYDKYFKKYILPSNYEEIDYYEKIDKDLINIIEKNNIHVFTYSLSMNHPNLFFIPLGISKNFNHFYLKKNTKETLCYLNIGIPCDRWHGNPRKDILKLLENKSFIKKRNGLDYLSFYTDISKSKFAICPRGCGIDTYRLWDCIAIGCIPIVEKYDSHEQFADLPILFLDKIEDYGQLSEEFLNQKYEEFAKRDFNYDKCKLEYWENKIINYKV
jgi:hypothetical protein